jgi:hypothetical protein
LIEICSEHHISKTTLIEWRDKLITGASEVFIPFDEKNKQVKTLQQEIALLHNILGEVTVENSFLKKKLIK